MVVPSLQQYIEQLFGGEDPLLTEMREAAAAEGLPSIQVPFELGRLLQWLIREHDVRQVLEIGTLFGYSAVLMARALPENGKVITIEANTKHAAIARRNLRRAGVQDKVEIQEGRGVDVLPRLRAQKFDLVFIDADKESYPQYLDLSLPLVDAGSVIVADNVWRGGAVVNPEDDNATARGAAAFNAMLAREPRLFSTLVPTRDAEDATSISIVLPA